MAASGGDFAYWPSRQSPAAASGTPSILDPTATVAAAETSPTSTPDNAGTTNSPERAARRQALFASQATTGSYPAEAGAPASDGVSDDDLDAWLVKASYEDVLAKASNGHELVELLLYKLSLEGKVPGDGLAAVGEGGLAVRNPAEWIIHLPVVARGVDKARPHNLVRLRQELMALRVDYHRLRVHVANLELSLSHCRHEVAVAPRHACTQPIHPQHTLTC